MFTYPPLASRPGMRALLRGQLEHGAAAGVAAGTVRVDIAARRGGTDQRAAEVHEAAIGGLAVGAVAAAALAEGPQKIVLSGADSVAEHRAADPVAAAGAGAVKRAADQGQRGLGVAGVDLGMCDGAAEAVQCFTASAGRSLVDRAGARCTAAAGGAVQVALLVHDQTSDRPSAVAAARESAEHAEGTARRHLEDGAAARLAVGEVAAIGGDAVEVARLVAYQLARRNVTVGGAVQRVERLVLLVIALGRQLIDGVAIRAVEIALPVSDHAGVRRRLLVVEEGIDDLEVRLVGDDGP